MISFFVLGVCAMAGHHFFCRSLDGRIVDTNNIYGSKISQQALFSAAGNAIASTAAFLFASVVGISIVQIMWYSFRHKPHTIEEIDAILECRTSPFTPGSWSAWASTRRLTALAILGAAMTLITVFAPGALGTTTVDFALKQACTIPTVDLSQGTFGVEWSDGNSSAWYPSPGLRQLVNRNAVAASYVAPASPCGVCSYELTLNAPAMQCQNVTDTYDFSSMTNGIAADVLFIWSSMHNLPIGNSIYVATAEGVKTNLQAAFCSVFSATYVVNVMHNGSLSTMDVKNVKIGQAVSSLDTSAPDAVAIRSVALATAQHLYGIVAIDVNKMQDLLLTNNPLSTNFPVFYDALGGPGPTGSKTWKWKGDMVNVLPQLMTNISISMLSNPLGAQQRMVQTQCSYSGIVYAYKPSQLLLTYGVGTVVTIICALAGFWSIWHNGVQESGNFSRLLASVLNDRLFDVYVTMDTKVKAESNPEGHFIPA